MAHQLGVNIHKLTFCLPKFETYETGSKLGGNETIQWVEYIRDCHQELKEESREILRQLDKLGRKINRFISAVEKGHEVRT